MLFSVIWLVAFELVVKTIGGGDNALEPSVQNEVDRAIEKGEAWLRNFEVTSTNQLAGTAFFATNNLTREAIALKLVSMQRNDGYWITETNSVPTEKALEILKFLSEEGVE